MSQIVHWNQTLFRPRNVKDQPEKQAAWQAQKNYAPVNARSRCGSRYGQLENTCVLKCDALVTHLKNMPFFSLVLISNAILYSDVCWADPCPFFEYSSHGNWIEARKDGTQAFSFKETYRDASRGVVELFDGGRGIRLRYGTIAASFRDEIECPCFVLGLWSRNRSNTCQIAQKHRMLRSNSWTR